MFLRVSSINAKLYPAELWNACSVAFSCWTTVFALLASWRFYITKRLVRLLVLQTQATSENCLNSGIAWQVHEAKPCQLVKFQIHHGWCSHHGVVLYEKLKCWHLGVAWSLHSSATRNDQFQAKATHAIACPANICPYM